MGCVVVAFEFGRSFQMRMRRLRGAAGSAALLCGAVLLSGCDLDSGGGFGREESTRLGPRIIELGQPVPKGGGRYKVGAPYRLNGQLFVPQEVGRYDTTGVASWYGELFHGRRTANGEIYDMEALTAAHPTLPMPSLARITNLQNGRSLVVRVNDRGPYARGRAIDLSWAVASLLQVQRAGTAPVRIQYLGPAPLNGDDSYERQVLAHQRWAGPHVAFAASPAKAMRYRRAASEPAAFYGNGRQRTSMAPAVPVTSYSADPVGFDTRPMAGAGQPRKTASLPPSVKAPVTAAAGHVSAAPPSRASATAPPFGKAASVASPRRHTAPVSAKAQRQRPAYIEAGLFPDQRLAERLASTLTDLAPVALEPETIGGATLHRLRVGPFANQMEAEAAVVRMRAAGLTGAYLQPVPGG
jgi:rare lipoprotein A